MFQNISQAINEVSSRNVLYIAFQTSYYENKRKKKFTFLSWANLRKLDNNRLGNYDSSQILNLFNYHSEPFEKSKI